MSKLRKKFITVLAVLFCALLALSVSLIIPKSRTANAVRQTGTDHWTEIGEIYNNGYASTGRKAFDAVNLRKLYMAITGDKHATYKTLESALAQNSTDTLTDVNGTHYIASNTIRANNGNKNVSLTFGGIKWDVTYVTVDMDGNIIVDLWQSSDNISSTLSQWATHSLSTANSYSCGHYSTSYIRVVTLNAGGYYSNANGTDTVLSSFMPKNAINTYGYARFTMANGTYSSGTVTNSLTDYIVKPERVKYQETEYSDKSCTGSGADAETGNNCLNDAWGTPARGNFGTVGADMRVVQQGAGSSDTKYGAWKGDYLWLPSVAEAGRNGCTNIINGIWKTDVNLRCSGTTASAKQTWQRSTIPNEPNYIHGLSYEGEDNLYPNIAANGSLLVRPALHLNLTKAAEAAKGVSFDAVELTNVKEGKEVAYDETDHTFTTVYNGNDVKVKLLDNDYLDLTDSYLGNEAPLSIATFSNGEFKANRPKKDADETYTIKVKPQTDPADGKSYVWDDNNGTEEREYKIEITRAGIDADWDTLTRGIGEDVLQDLAQYPITSATGVSNVNFVDTYKVATSSADYETGQPSTWNTTGWKPRAVGDPDFNITQSVTYVVYYEITADYHEAKRGSYNVDVTSDSVKFTANDPENAVSTAEYGSNQAKDLTKQSELLELFRNNVSMAGKDGALDQNTIDYIMSRVDVKLFTKNANGKRTNITFNENDILPVGDYYLELEWNVDPEYRTVSFNWNASTYIKFTIDPKTIAVQIVAENGGALTHVYGDDGVALTYKVNQSDLVGDDGITDLKLGTIFIENTNNTKISSSTAVGTYNLTSKQTGTSNYKVNLAPCQYVVTKRTVALQVADKEIEYGTILGTPTYEDLVEIDSLVNGDILASVIKSITYSITNDIESFEVDDILLIGEYVLGATAEADNYTFNITAGKLTVTKANFDLSGVKLKSEGYIYNGEPHPAKLSGDELPTGVSCTFRYVNYDTGEELAGAPVEVGLYLVYASFSHDNSNYNKITEVKAAYIRIAYTQEELNQPYPPLPSDADLAAAADLAKKKTEAKKTLDEEAKKKKDEIDADVNLTPEEKKAAKDEIDEELKKGNEAIDKAKDKDGVNKAYDDGKKEMEDTADLAQKKGAAKSELDKAAQAKKDAIDNNPDLTDEEKQAAKDKVDEELAKGKAEINGATDISGVQSAESSTKTNIENIKPEHKGSFPWWILAVIAGAIVLVTVLIIVIVKRRNAEDDDDGYDDFYDDEYDYEEEEESDDGDEAYGF